MVTTPIVLETVRKTDLVETTLDEIYRSLQSFRGYAGSHVTTREENGHSLKLKKAIVAICASGEGTAQKMKEMLDKHLEKYFDVDIEVLPISVIDMDKQLVTLQQKYEILATTGIVKPKIDAVYIPMEHFFNGDAEKVLDYLVEESESYDENELTSEKAKQICLEYHDRDDRQPDEQIRPFRFFNGNAVFQLFFETLIIEKYRSDKQADDDCYPHIFQYMKRRAQKDHRHGKHLEYRRHRHKAERKISGTANTVRIGKQLFP